MKNRNRLSYIGMSLLIVMFGYLSTAAILWDGNSETSKKDIVTIAVEAGSFKTLATALKEADLISDLQSEGPFTVFAPTDEAFAKIPKETLNNLLADKESLKKVLLYHVVKGKVSSKEVVALDNVLTLAQKKININVSDGNVMINNSKVVSVDIQASNGIIHVIDEVLLP